MSKRASRVAVACAIGAAAALALPGIASAQDELSDAVIVQAALDNIWVLIAGCLVFFMQVGFAFLESGLTRAKNVVNVMAKNFADAFIGILCFFAVGWAFAYGDGNAFIGFDQFFLSGQDLSAIVDDAGDPQLSPGTDFFFQAVFAATAITIAAGAMAERTKFVAYLLYAAVVTAFIYPVVVHWTWGGGFIAEMSIGDAVFSDFAGSSIVHLTGGVLALMGAVMLGPRIGKYGPDGKPRAIPGHSIPFAVIGVFILWLGWFGFNPGSELAANGWVGLVAVNTMLAAIAGGLSSTVVIWLRSGKPDLTMIGNGVLAGLVSITAGAGTMNTFGSVVAGAVGGALVVLAVAFFDRIRIDDPVGAIAVHGAAGVWGTLAIGLFARHDDAFLGRDNAGLFYGGGIEQLVMQAVLVVIVVAWVAATSFIFLLAIKKTVGLRVSEEEERAGLDVAEHGLVGYPEDATA